MIKTKDNSERAVLNVIIADDSDILRTRLVENLSQFQNVNVVGEAGDVATVKQMINEIEFNLGIYDIKMLNENGIDLMKDTKKKYPNTKVIMMSNYSISSYKNECLEAGADYFFDKSDLDEMMALIEELSKIE